MVQINIERAKGCVKLIPLLPLRNKAMQSTKNV